MRTQEAVIRAELARPEVYLPLLAGVLAIFLLVFSIRSLLTEGIQPVPERPKIKINRRRWFIELLVLAIPPALFLQRGFFSGALLYEFLLFNVVACLMYRKGYCPECISHIPIPKKNLATGFLTGEVIAVPLALFLAWGAFRYGPRGFVLGAFLEGLLGGGFFGGLFLSVREKPTSGAGAS